MIPLAQLIEPRVPSALPAIHLLVLVGALAWAGQARRLRAPPPGSWRLAMSASAFTAAGDVLLVISAWSTGLAIFAFTVGFILGLSLLLLSLLQGWPHRPLLMISALSVVAPFLLWL